MNTPPLYWTRFGYNDKYQQHDDLDSAAESAARCQESFTGAQRMNDLQPKLEAFRALVEAQNTERYRRQFGTTYPGCCTAACRTRIKPGRKYTKVDVGDSGRYMVENSTGEIYGIKAYGVIHRGHHYGHLDDTAAWYWGEYAPFKKPAPVA